MNNAAGAPPDEAHDQSCLRWFKTGFAVWVTRSPVQHQKLIESLGSSCFEQTYREWIDATPEPSPDLRRDRHTFVDALSAAGEVAMSSSHVLSLVITVDHFRLEPQQQQDRASLRQVKTQTQLLRHSVQQVIEALEFLERPDPIQRATGFDRVVVMSNLLSLLADSLLGRALREQSPAGEPSELLRSALTDLSRRLQRHLDGWDRNYGLENKRDPDEKQGRTQNMAAHHLVHRLADIYEAMGGEPVVSWSGQGITWRPKSPFGKFLVLIYVALPRSARRHAAESPSAFLRKAARVLADGQARASWRSQPDVVARALLTKEEWAAEEERARAAAPGDGQQPDRDE